MPPLLPPTWAAPSAKSHRCSNHRLPILVLLFAHLSWHGAQAAEPLPKQLEGIGVAEHLGQHIDPNLSFIDEQGRHASLGSYLKEGLPVLLTLNYYRCKMLCSLQLNALVRGLRALPQSPGTTFRAITLSINPRETVTLAREKRNSYLKALGRGEVDWHFHIGSEAAISSLARQLGFRYRYIAEEDQYAHPAVIFFLAPDGSISRYLYGLDYPARDLRFALLDASQGRTGSTLDKVLLSCFHFDPHTGRYTAFALGIMRLGGLLTLIILALLIGLTWRGA